MLSPLIIVAILGGYLALLAVFGWWAEKSWKFSNHSLPRSVLYGLSLATLCSAWTYFGAIGDTSNGSWLFLANAIGPILAITLGYPIWRRIAILSKQENVGSLRKENNARGKLRGIAFGHHHLRRFVALRRHGVHHHQPQLRQVPGAVRPVLPLPKHSVREHRHRR